MKTILSVLVGLVVASAAWAQGVVPDGVTGLWRFQNADEKYNATFGIDMTSTGDNAWFSGPWTSIGYDWHGDYYADGGCIQTPSWQYLTVDPGFTANGGGVYVNQYTIAIDYVQTSHHDQPNSLFQTAFDGRDNEGDLWTDGSGHIGSGDLGYSMLSYDASTWHRIVWSVDNGDDFGSGGFFRVYVDGVLFLDAPGQRRDGRYSLYPDRFHLFADNDWKDRWGLVGTVATWDRALTTAEIYPMGGWLLGSSMPTPLLIPTPERIPGDANGDRRVDDDDAKTLAANWGKGGGWEQGDFNFDGVVNAADAAIMAANWGYDGTSEATAVPEPGTTVMLFLAAFGLAVGVRRGR